MTRYFFHTQNGRFMADREEMCLASHEDMRAHAIQISAEMLLEENASGWSAGERQVTVTDESGATVFTLSFLGLES